MVGRVTGSVHIWGRGGHYWVFSRMTFTTIDGRRMVDIPSVVTVWGLSDGAHKGRRPPTIGFAFRTLALATAAAFPTWGFLQILLANLPL